MAQFTVQFLCGLRHSKKAVRVCFVLNSYAERFASGQNFLIGSCKYKNEQIGTDELRLIQDYSAIFTSAKDDCFYYIFSKSGFTNGLKEQENAVNLLTLEDLYHL